MNEAPLRLVGTHEVCVLLGVSRQRVYQLAGRPDFPRPVARLAQGKIWDLTAIEEWIRTHRTPRQNRRQPPARMESTTAAEGAHDCRNTHQEAER